MSDRRPPAEHLRLLVSDIDGTLVTPDKSLTLAALDAAGKLDAAGVGLTLVSSRPARGMAAIGQRRWRLEAALRRLQWRQPSIAPDMKTDLRSDGYPGGCAVARRHRAVPQANGVAVWTFADDQWQLKDDSGLDVDRERHTVGFDPTVVANFDGVIDRIDKLVGVSDQPDLLADVEAEAQDLLQGRANARNARRPIISMSPTPRPTRATPCMRFAAKSAFQRPKRR